LQDANATMAETRLAVVSFDFSGSIFPGYTSGMYPAAPEHTARARDSVDRAISPRPFQCNLPGLILSRLETWLHCFLTTAYAFFAVMGVSQVIRFGALIACTYAAPFEERNSKPKSFLKEIRNSTWVIGNEIWNTTQGRQYANKLWYKGKDRVGDAVGHYVSYSTLTYPMVCIGGQLLTDSI
jgi:hypothetical protein